MWPPKSPPMSAQDLENLYDDFIASSLSASRWDHGLNVWEERLLSLIPPGANVLSVGTGTGREIPHLLSRHCSIVAMDPSPEALRILQERFRGQIHLIRARLAATPHPPLRARFRAVVALGHVLGGSLQPEGRSGFLRHAVALMEEDGVFLFDAALNGEHPPGVRVFPYELSEGVNVTGCAYFPSRQEIEEALRAMGVPFTSWPMEGPRVAFAVRHPGQGLPHVRWPSRPSPSSRSSWDTA